MERKSTRLKWVNQRSNRTLIADCTNVVDMLPVLGMQVFLSYQKVFSREEAFIECICICVFYSPFLIVEYTVFILSLS